MITAGIGTSLVMALIVSATLMGFAFFITVTTIGHLLLRKWHESELGKVLLKEEELV